MGEDAYYAGEAFPLRFKLEASADANFARPHLIVDYTSSDFENPKYTILYLPAANLRARYVRLTATKLAEPECRKEASEAPEANTPCSATGDYYLALSKIAVLSAGKDIAVGRPSSADETYGNPDDLQQFTRPDRIETEFIHHDRPENVTEASTWTRVPYAAQAPLGGVTLHGGVFEATMRNNIRYLLDSFTIDDLLLQFRERVGKPIPPREGAAEAYDQAHREVWPEMIEMLKRGGVSEYSIFRRDNLLFLTFKAVDFEATWSQFDDDPVNLRWQKAMAPFFAPHEVRPGERFPMMQEVFFLP